MFDQATTASFTAMRDAMVTLRDGGHVNVWHRPGSETAGTAVLVHGLTGTSRWWAPVLEHLPSELGIAAIDVRGRGASHDSPGPYDIHTLARDLIDVMDALQVGSAVMAGYSMGAWVVSVAAAAHADRIERVLLVDGGIGRDLDPDSDPDDVLRAAVGPSLHRLDMEFSTPQAYFDFWRAHPAFSGFWDDRLTDVFGYELGPEGKVRASPEAILTNGREITVDPSLRTAAAAISTPGHLLIVDHGMMGQPGGFVSEDAARAAAEANSGLTYDLLTDLNHYSLMLGAGSPAVANHLIGAAKSSYGSG